MYIKNLNKYKIQYEYMMIHMLEAKFSVFDFVIVSGVAGRIW